MRLFKPKSSGERQPTAPAAWRSENLFFDGDAFFKSLLDALGSARRSIQLESYIFERDELGQRVARQLVEAARRGVDVRVIVDGIGSAGWEARFGDWLRHNGVRYKVYHQLPWERYSMAAALARFSGFFSLLEKINQRNHRKLCIIDGQRAFIGSMNISTVHLPSLQGSWAWRDLAICVEGEAVSELAAAFEHSWSSRRQRVASWLRRPRQGRPGRTLLVRHNSWRGLRERNYRDLLKRMLSAKHRIWITNSYFVPPGSLLRALKHAAQHGVDVRLLVPRQSDVYFLPWVTAAFYFGLHRAGARVYEFLPAMLHAKSMLIDDWAIVGSSNLNHRSIFHDLEADVVVTGPQTREALVEAFLKNLEQSHEIFSSGWRERSCWERLLGRLALLGRYWL